MVENGIYQHYKGKYYEVIGLTTHSETLEQLVLYRPLYGEMNLWVRPLAMFEEEIGINNELVKRFKLVTTDLSKLMEYEEA